MFPPSVQRRLTPALAAAVRPIVLMTFAALLLSGRLVSAQPGDPPSPTPTSIPDLGEGYLGVVLTTVEIPDVLPLAEAPTLVEVDRILPESPAAASDFAEGDIILRYDARPLRDPRQLVDWVRAARPGTEARVTLLRGGRTFVQPVLLGVRPEFEDVLETYFEGNPAPPLSARHLRDGSPLDLDGSRVVVLDFWATWCGPCRRLLPQLNDLYHRYADAGVAVFGVSSELPEDIRAFIDDNPVDYTIGYDVEEQSKRDYWVSAYPTVFLIDADGTIREVYIGGDMMPQLEQDLRRLIGLPSAE